MCTVVVVMRMCVRSEFCEGVLAKETLQNIHVGKRIERPAAERVEAGPSIFFFRPRWRPTRDIEVEGVTLAKRRDQSLAGDSRSIVVF
jgi:hypothetical protein